LAVALTLALIVAAAPSVSLAAQGDCGQPVSPGDGPTATDCLFILRAAVGSSTCDPVCICDLNGSLGNPNATDALTCLNVAVGTPGLLNCPCSTTTTTTNPVTTSTTTSTTTEPPSSTTTSTTTTTTGGGGGACPDTVELTVFGQVSGDCSTNDDCEIGTCDTGLGLCATATELDTGWKGISHDADVNDRQQIIASLDNCDNASAPCGVCEVTGIDPTNRMCRCANDNQAICDQPFVADADDCGGAVCNCYLGPPLPLSAGNTPACVVNRFGEDLSGTVNVDTGTGAGPVSLRSVVYLGIDVFTPCPYCGSGCTAPALNLGLACAANADCDTKTCSGASGGPCQSDLDCQPDNGTCVSDGNGACGSEDVTPGDGNRDGTCVGQGSLNAGDACDVDADNTTFPWRPGDIGGGSSLDCFPSSGLNVSGSGLQISLGLTTGSQQLTSGVPCGLLPFIPETCTCGECSLNTAIPCSSDAECAAASAGTCRTVGQDGRPDNCAGGGICNDAGGGEGVCAEGPNQGYCDGALRSNGEPFVTCSSNADCAVYDNAGSCTLSRTLECFLPTITAQGDPDPDYPIGVSTFCIPRTSSSAINTVAGIPGPGRVKNQGRTRKFCGGIGGTEYVENSGCP
jgi:hypothetical protein